MLKEMTMPSVSGNQKDQVDQVDQEKKVTHEHSNAVKQLDI